MFLKRKFAGLFVVSALALAVVGCGDDPVDPTQNFVNPSTVRVTNNLGGSVLFFRVRTCGTSDFGPDLLSNDPVTGVIPVGTTKEFTVEAGCYDLKAEHLEFAMPGPLLEKTIFDQTASPIAALTWVLEEVASGPS